jgi:hypothetical protein
MLYGLRPPWLNSAGPLVWSFFFGALSYSFRLATDFQTSRTQFICFELMVGLMFLALLYRQRSTWLVFVLSAVIQRRPLNAEIKADPEPSTLDEHRSLAARLRVL